MRKSVMLLLTTLIFVSCSGALQDRKKAAKFWDELDELDEKENVSNNKCEDIILLLDDLNQMISQLDSGEVVVDHALQNNLLGTVRTISIVLNSRYKDCITNYLDINLILDRLLESQVDILARKRELIRLEDKIKKNIKSCGCY